MSRTPSDKDLLRISECEPVGTSCQLNALVLTPPPPASGVISLANLLAHAAVVWILPFLRSLVSDPLIALKLIGLVVVVILPSSLFLVLFLLELVVLLGCSLSSLAVIVRPSLCGQVTGTPFFFFSLA